jgi:small neutral amino acid transporter SnatA (MarC family)
VIGRQIHDVSELFVCPAYRPCLRGEGNLLHLIHCTTVATGLLTIFRCLVGNGFFFLSAESIWRLVGQTYKVTNRRANL